MKRRLNNLPTNRFYKELIAFNADIYLTTNYDHAFYNNDESVVETIDFTEKIYSIRRKK